MTITSEYTIEKLYMEIKDVFIQPAKVTNMYKQIKEGYNRKTKVDRRHGSPVWFNNNCEMLRRKCMSITNSISISSTPYETTDILLYGSKVWGFTCTEMLETFHMNFLRKKLLHLRPSLTAWGTKS